MSEHTPDELSSEIIAVDRLKAINDDLLAALEPLTDYFNLPHGTFMEKYSTPSTSGQKMDAWLRERAQEARVAIDKAKEAS